MYLYHSDIELANEAFYKAQVLDPDFAAAWVGQGLVAVLNDHQREALALFEHATGLAVPAVSALSRMPHCHSIDRPLHFSPRQTWSLPNDYLIG